MQFKSIGVTDIAERFFRRIDLNPKERLIIFRHINCNNG